MFSLAELIPVLLWLDICDANLSQVGGDWGFHWDSLDSSWGVTYDRITPPTNEVNIESVAIYRANQHCECKWNPPSPTLYYDSDLEYGNVSNLIDGMNPKRNTSGPVNVAGDINMTTLHDHCLRLDDGPNDPKSFALQNNGLIIEVNLTRTYKLYKAQMSFAYDGGAHASCPYNCGNGTYCNDCIQLPVDPTWIKVFVVDYESKELVTLNSSDPAWKDQSNVWFAEDWRWWETDNLTSASQTVLTESVQFYVGNLGESSSEGNDWAYAVCEVVLYGLPATGAPTQFTLSPTAAPTRPTLSPTPAPTASPSLSPTDDACPNFDVVQPCCANRGGFRYVSNTYNRVTNERVPDTDLPSCYYVFENQQCCGNGSYTPISDADTEIFCNDNGALRASGRDGVCDPSLLTRENTLPWYGFEVVNGTNTVYTPRGYPTPPDCACTYVIQVCETRRVDLECLGDTTLNPPENVLCATNLSDPNSTAIFVGGGDMHLLSFTDVLVDPANDLCGCNYIADNCLDDIAYRDEFEIPGNIEDNDACTINYIYPCCRESELAFGGVPIPELDLPTYAQLAADSSNEWHCLNSSNEYDLCHFEDIPRDAVLNTDQHIFSWTFSGFSPYSYGFNDASFCACHIAYNNCTTLAPTGAPTLPSVSPTSAPTTLPTKAPTFYQFDDYKHTDVTQPCCGGSANVSVAGGVCTDDDEVACSLERFQGESGQIQPQNSGGNFDAAGECSCLYDVGFWDWQIDHVPELNVEVLKLGVWTWMEIVPNVTWDNSTVIDVLFSDESDNNDSSSDNSTRRRLQMDIDCMDVYVTVCDTGDVCPAESQPNLAENNLLKTIGRTFERWIDFVSDTTESICFCYWMFFKCYIPTTTEPSSPTTPPTTGAPTTGALTTSSLWPTTTSLPPDDDKDAAVSLLENRLGAVDTMYQSALGSFAVICVLLCCCAAIDGYCIRKNHYLHLIYLLLFAVQAMDMLSDCFFAAQLSIYHRTDATVTIAILLYASICFIVVPVLTTLYQLFRHIQKKWAASQDTSAWLMLHSNKLYLVSILCGGSFSAVRLMNSDIFQLEIFHMGLSERELKRFNTKRLWSVVLLENMPQLLLQSYFLGAFMINGVSAIGISSIIFSCISMVVSVFGLATDRKIFSNEKVTMITVEVTGSCVADKQARARCRTRKNELQNELAMVLRIDRNSLEIMRPAPINGGLLLKLYIYESTGSQSQFKSMRVVQSTANVDRIQAITDSVQSGDLSKIVHQAWQLEAPPIVSNLQHQIFLSSRERALKDIIGLGEKQTSLVPQPEPVVDTAVIELQRVEEDVIDFDKVDLTYMAEFTQKPFGFAFGTDPYKRDKRNLYVTEVDIDSVAEQLHVMVGSFVIAFGDETVEGKGAKKIFQIFQQTYVSQLPLTMVFKQCNADAAAVSDHENGEHLYSVLFTKSPFGIKFGKNANDANNLYVDKIDDGSIAEKLKVQIGSKVVQFENERVEGMGRSNVLGVFKEKYSKQLPLRVVFCSPPKNEIEIESEHVGLIVVDAAEEDEKLSEDDMYSVTLTERPFGFTFGKDKSDPDNLFVTQIDDHGQAQQLGVIMSSKIVRFENETVEGIGATDIFKIYQKKYAKKLPLKVVFFKPVSQEDEGDGHERQLQLNELSPDMYMVQFTQRPFGASFGKQPSDPNNLYVKLVDDGGHAQELNVLARSRIIRIQNENVEGIGAKQVFRVFTKYSDVLPLTVVFKTPHEQAPEQVPTPLASPGTAAAGEGDHAMVGGGKKDEPEGVDKIEIAASRNATEDWSFVANEDNWNVREKDHNGYALPHKGPGSDGNNKDTGTFKAAAT